MIDDPQAGGDSPIKPDWAQTISMLSRRIEQEPQKADFWVRRAIAFRFLRDFKSATNDIEEALRLDPGSVRAHSCRGNLFLDAGQLTAAMSMYDRAIALDPANTWSYFHRAIAYAKQGRPAEAIRDSTKAIELKPDCEAAYLNRGIAIEDIEGYRAALLDYDFFLRLESKPSELAAIAYGLRAFVRLKSGLFHEAIEDFDKKLLLTPNDALAYLGRGRARRKLGDLQEAVADRDKAFELDPTILDDDGGTGKEPQERR
jgi:tetratricopeptide (TPR) repeat protein